jgi:hypothetical protein
MRSVRILPKCNGWLDFPDTPRRRRQGRSLVNRGQLLASPNEFRAGDSGASRHQLKRLQRLAFQPIHDASPGKPAPVASLLPQRA